MFLFHHPEPTISPSKVYHLQATYSEEMAPSKAYYGNKAKYSDWVPLDSTTSTTCTSNNPLRPGLVHRPSVQTRYMDMLLGLDDIPPWHNILASFFTWVLLAGYVVFPATFTSLNRSKNLAQVAEDGNEFEKQVLNTVRNAPLVYIATICCIVGASGMVWLWCKWRSNYIWVINRIFTYVCRILLASPQLSSSRDFC